MQYTSSSEVGIVLKTPEEIEVMDQANRIILKILEEFKKIIKPGITTLELDRYAERRIKEMGAEPAFKGYRGYPFTICASVNEEVVHGLPKDRPLKEGDIVSIDMGAFYRGFYSDAAYTYPVGKVSRRARKLMRVTFEALHKGISKARPGNRLTDISHAIQRHVEKHGFSVVRYFVGHGIGRKLHEEPQVPNFGIPGKGPVLRPGMVLAIEPMVNEGTYEVEILEDGWTAVTKDRKLSAHYEYSVAITEKGPRILGL